MVTKDRRRAAGVAGAVLLIAAVGYYYVWGRSGATPGLVGAPAAVGGSGAAQASLPRIDLDRLQGTRAQPQTTGRDIFAFAAPPPPPPPPPTPIPQPVPQATPVASVPTGPPPPPPLNVKFVGLVEDKRGLRVAVLLTDRKETLFGQAGETVANRLKIVAIGHESVDVQDVGSERVRRIPLKGN